jgi:hypothetical protein
MRVAAEVTGDYKKFCYGPLPNVPDGFSAKSFAALSIWWLLSQGRAAARKNLPDQELTFGMTIGIPMSFYTNSGLRATFLDVARAAWYLSRLNGDLEGSSIALDRALTLVAQAFDEVRKRDVSPDSVRDWIRSEAEAAMYSAYRSPSVAPGTYAKVDVGAGTTNASVFRITDTFEGGHWVKSGMAFYGADSGSTGMDAIDSALWKLDPTGKPDCLELRGLEATILADGKAVRACQAPIDEIVAIGRRPWKQLKDTLGGLIAADPDWKKCIVYLFGGGGDLLPLHRRIPVYPPDDSIRLRLGVLDIPSDLDFDFSGAVPLEILRFIQVAYGLSEPGLEVPHVDTPAQMPPWSPPRKKPFKDYDEF